MLAFAASPSIRVADDSQTNYLRECEVPSTQILRLAEAVPAEKYSWRPAPGVRSISEVYVHIAADNFLLLDMTGVKPPADLFPSLPDRKTHNEAIVKRSTEFEKTMTEKRQVIDLLKRSFAAVHDNFSQSNDTNLNQSTEFFGNQITAHSTWANRWPTHA